MSDVEGPGVPDLDDQGDGFDERDALVGDAGPEEDAETDEPDVLDEILANHGTGGWSDPEGDVPSTADDALDSPATGDEEVGAQPVELDSDLDGGRAVD